jgi:GNAT superfamily N-acetyltransferase
MNGPVAVRALLPHEARAQVGALSAVLMDCVAGGASVGFMAPLGRARAETFWQDVAEGVAAGERILLVAADRGTGRIVGTVQVVFARQENQPHRGDVAKMLVLRQLRGRGIGAALIAAAEDAARAAGKTLLVLDTVTGSAAERLYARAGWTRVGVIPNYALWPQGGYCDTTVFCKQIAPDAAESQRSGRAPGSSSHPPKEA